MRGEENERKKESEKEKKAEESQGAYRLAGPMFSPTGFSIVALERTAREAKAIFEVTAP